MIRAVNFQVALPIWLRYITVTALHDGRTYGQLKAAMRHLALRVSRDKNVKFYPSFSAPTLIFSYIRPWNLVTNWDTTVNGCYFKFVPNDCVCRQLSSNQFVSSLAV